VPLPHQELFGQIADGDTLALDDGRLRFMTDGHEASWVRTAATLFGAFRA
jgi:pyruvate kinase